jgi:hypothetical protein
MLLCLGWAGPGSCHVKDVLRGPPNEYADLRSRRPIEFKVTVLYTVTAVHKRI